MYHASVSMCIGDCSAFTSIRSCSSAAPGGRVWKRLATRENESDHAAGGALGVSHSEYFPFGSGFPSIVTS